MLSTWCHRIFTSFPPWKMIVLVVYVLLVAIGLWYHEIWQDEAQALLIVRDSPSFFSMLSEVRYENNGPLWYILLYPIVKLGGGIMAMQALHLAIAAGVAILILSMDIPWFFSIPMVFGYYFFYEYAVVARCYGLAILFLFLAARDLRARGPAWRIGLMLGLASLASNHALLLVVAFLPWFLWSEFHGPEWRWRVPAFVVVLAVCLALAAPFIASPADSIYTRESLAIISYTPHIPTDSLTASELILQNAFLPLPQIDWPQIWNVAQISVLWRGWLILIAAVVFVFSFAGKRSGAIFLTGALALVVFCSTVYFGGVRHHGLIWVWMLFALAIEPGVFKKIAVARFGRIVFLVFLILQVPRAGAMWTCDLMYPFSQGKAVAEWILKEAPGLPIGGTDLQSVSVYVGQPFYSLRGARAQTFNHQDVESFLKLGDSCANDPSLPDIWVVQSFITPWCEGFDFVEVASFPGQMILKDDDFRIFKRSPKSPPQLP